MPKLGMREVRRAQLIEATLYTIDEAGLPGTTLAPVAQRANISTGIVSHYFGDKDGLLEATMRHVLRDLWLATSRRRGAAAPEPRERLRAIVAANFDDTQVSAPVMKTWLAFWSQSMHQPQLGRLQRVNTRRLHSNLCAEFRQAAAARTRARRGGGPGRADRRPVAARRAGRRPDRHPHRPAARQPIHRPAARAASGGAEPRCSLIRRTS